MAGKTRGPNKKPKPKLTVKQSRFAKAFMKSHSLKDAALEAGYSPKNPTESGIQARKAILEKAPEVMGRQGLDLDTVIRKHLTPLLNATETKFAQHEGEYTDFVIVENLPIRMQATRTALELLNAFPPKDPALAAQVGVEVVIIDIPRPDYSKKAIKVKAAVSTSGKVVDDEDDRPKD